MADPTYLFLSSQNICHPDQGSKLPFGVVELKFLRDKLVGTISICKDAGELLFGIYWVILFWIFWFAENFRLLNFTKKVIINHLI